MKLMKKLDKKVKIAVAAVLAVALVGGIIFGVTRRSPSKTVQVVPVGNISTSYWGDSRMLDGFVTTGALQEVRMTEGGFDKVAVKDGAAVRKGDTLLEYDNTQNELQLRSDLARINLLKSQIAAFEKQITDDYKKIDALKKKLNNLPGGGTSGGDGDTTTPPTPLLPDEIMTETKPAGGEGTKEKPYRFNCSLDTKVTKEYLQSLQGGVENSAGAYAVFDIWDDSGTIWLMRWTVNKETLSGTSFAETEIKWDLNAGLSFNGTTFTGINPSTIKPYGTLSLTPPEDISSPVPPVDDGGLPNTEGGIKEEIKALEADIDNCEKQIDSSKRDLRQAQITYEKNKLTHVDGKVVASLDGVVSIVGDSTTPVGEVYLRVQGASNYAVTLYVNELLLGEVKPGTTVQLMCYESGTMAPAVITEIGTDPVTGYYSGGNANASTYQVTAEITDPEAQPRLGEWCQATMEGQSMEQPSDTIYLPLFTVREDEGGSYVMRAGDNDRLEKRYVVTGKSLWGSYIEIKSGVSLDDRVAFPYGKAVREGAPTVDADFFEGY